MSYLEGTTSKPISTFSFIGGALLYQLTNFHPLCSSFWLYLVRSNF